ncbi:unnamed protein product [Echinostoma caproni]|uniref:Uncharacterized protein n=1 Tax=Echinostoma caproni TaxID=27848 RepID=A0A183APL4_9TREM|nr:unnamed protein product [Echinostoma caproni]
MPSVVSSSSGPATIHDLPGFTTQVTTVNEVAPFTPVDSPEKRLTAPEIPFANLEKMRRFAEDLANSDAVASNSLALLGFLVEVYTDSLQTRIQKEKRKEQCTVPTKFTAGSNVQKTSEETKLGPDGQPVVQESLSDLLELALSTCDRLATEVDRIRANYWRYRARQLVAIGQEAGLEG